MACDLLCFFCGFPWRLKKRFPQFLLSMYVCLCVCVCVCLFVCLSVIALQTSSFTIGDTYMKISQNGIGPILDDRLTHSLKIKKIVKNEKGG